MNVKITVPRVKRWVENRRAQNALKPLLEFLDGKSVAIVGNAASLLDYCHGALIDGHEIVTRMNTGFPVKPEAQGRRFDLWCFSHRRALRGAPADFVMPRRVWMSPTLREKADERIRCHFYPLANWRRLHDLLGSRPSVGAMTIDLISCSRPRQVTIIGFDFNRSKSFYENRESPAPHDFAAESRYILDMAERRSWRFVAT